MMLKKWMARFVQQYMRWFEFSWQEGNDGKY